MKKIIFIIVLSILSFTTFAAESGQMWIAIEMPVLAKIKKSKFPVFSFSDVITSAKENYYLVDDDQLINIAKFIHHNFKRCGGFRVLLSPPSKKTKIANKDAGEIIYKDFWPNELDQYITVDYNINQENTVKEWHKFVSSEHIDSIITHLSSYHTRYYKSPEGEMALKWIGETWENLTRGRSDAKVDYYQYKTHKQPTVILTITGSDPTLKNEVIILGGHGDSINCDDQEANLRAPGANDNAAGIAVLTDIIKIFVEQNYKPKHTIQFIAYAAEEVGIQGSYELAHVYHQDKIKVIGVLQFDGINYQGKSFDMALIADSTHPEQNKFMGSLIDTYLKTSWTYDRCGYGCSDHAAWHSEGYRASFPVEAIMSEQDPYIHTAEDTFSKSFNNSLHAQKFEKLGIAYLIEMDN
jgi:leucyl aminopeptidase